MNDTTSPRDTAARSMDERVRYLAAIADSSDYAVIGQDADGIIVAWNRGAQRIYGYGPDEIIGQPFHRLVPDERRDEITTLNRRVRQDGRGEHHVTEACRKDGSRFQVALAFLPVLDPHGHATGTSVIGRDITVEMKAVEEKQRAADLLDKIFSGIRILLAYMDRDFNFIKVNRAYAEADEREPEYFVGKNHFDLYPNAENEAMFRLVVETGEPAFVAERPFVYAAHPERGVSYWDWVVQPVRGANGRVEGVLLSLLDVTEKVKTRQKLEATVAYTRSLIEANLDPLVTIGRDGRITDVNRATETVTGRTRQQLVGTDFSDYFTEPEKAQNGYRQAFEQGQVRDYPLEIRHADGHVTPVLYNASVYRDAEGKVVGVFAAARDISERRRAEEALRASEERLRQAQRIAQIGSWELDLVTNVLYWSDEIYRIFEIDKESFGASYEAFLGLVHPDDREAVNRAYNTSVATRTPYSIDHRLLFPDGRIKYVHEQCETFYAEDGTPLRSIGTVQDITARKRAEHLLELRTREQEAIAAVGYAALTGGSLDEFMERAVQLVAETLEVEFTKILELSPEGGDLLLRAGAGWRPGLVQRERVSAGLESQAGYTLMAAEPVIVSDYATENRFPEAPLLREHGVRSGISVIIGERARPYGVLAAHSVEQRDFSRDDVSFLQAVANVVATAVERAHAEEALREANAYNRRLIEASLDPLVTIGPNGTITDVNAATEAVTGRTRGELIGTDFADYFTDPEAARAGYRQVFEQGFVRNYPLEIRHADGHITPVLYNASVYRDEKGEVIGIFAAARDISERLRAEAALREANAYNRRLIEASLDPLVTIGPNGTITDVNAATEAVTGRTRGELIGTDFADYFTDPEAARAGYRQVFEQGFVRNYPLEIRHADGHITPVLYNASVYRDEKGEVIGIFAAARDVSERLRAEAALHEANAYNRRLIEASLDPLVTIGRDGTITDVNAATEAVTGRTRGELIGTDFADYFTDPEAARAGYRQVFEQGFVRNYPLEIRHADGHTTPVLYNASVYRDEKGEVIGVFAAARDVSERLRAEAALREANAYNRRLIEASLDPLVTIGPNGTITDVNAATEKITGCSREELIGTDFSDYFTEPERARAGYRQAFEQGFVVDYPLEIRRTDGHVTPVLYNAAVYRDERGEVQGVFAAARDISARKRAEEEAQRLGRRNELLLQSAGEGIYGLDRQGRCTFMNPAGAAMLGYAPEELVGRSLHEVIHHSRADGTPYPVEECRVHKAYTEAAVFRGTDEVFWRRDGRAFPIEYVSTPIIEDGRLTGAVVAFLDITERKEAEEALRRLNRELDERVKARTAELEEANKELESFSYSVSHDLRTPLRAIDGFSKILLVEHRDKLDEEGKRLLGIVRENTEKMGQLISDILAFSRTSRAALTKMPVDVRVLIAEVWDELRALEPERAYDFHLGALPPAEGDRALLRQVFSNLLANAVKFTRGREVARIEVTGEQTDSEVVYHVRDNGVGFDMRYVDRLFGVFQRLHSATEFEGTGIGLAVVKRIIVRHGGRVWAEGRPGEGATFHVALPRTGDGAQVDATGEQP